VSSRRTPTAISASKTKARRSLGGLLGAQDVEATTGFEPVNRGFADLRVEPLHHVALCGSPGRRPQVAGCPSRVRTSVHGFKVRCPTTRRRGSGPRDEWSGRRDSNPRPSPWQGDALPTEPLPLEIPSTHGWCREPGSNWRHRDFQSRALPTELSRPDGQPAVGCPSAGGTIPRASKGHQGTGRSRRGPG
jgi:hypothetical protein